MSKHHITRSAGVMAIAIAISRILGLVRDQVFAFFFGSSMVAEAFIVAFRIPNLLRDLFAEGALSQAYVPVIAQKILQKGDAAGWRLTNLVINWQVVILMPITILGMIFAPQVVDAIASGFTGEKFNETVLLTRIMFPFIVMVGVASVFMGTLNVRHIFFIPASASSKSCSGTAPLDGSSNRALFPSRLELNTNRDPSGDQTGFSSAAGSVVRRVLKSRSRS